MQQRICDVSAGRRRPVRATALPFRRRPVLGCFWLLRLLGKLPRARRAELEADLVHPTLLCC